VAPEFRNAFLAAIQNWLKAFGSPSVLADIKKRPDFFAEARPL
jgi:hypothetical protein